MVTDFALDMKPEDVPYLPWAKKMFDERKDGAHSSEAPDAHCLPQGVPKIDSVQYPWKVVYTPNSIVIIYESFNYWRQISRMDALMSPDANPTWFGYCTRQRVPFASTLGNVTVQVGKDPGHDGVLLVDTGPGRLTQRMLGEIAKLTHEPVRYIVNTIDRTDNKLIGPDN